jgi:predicted transcriptional regulator
MSTSDRHTRRPRLGQFSVRLAPEVVEVVERVASEERRTPSNVVRNALADWAAARTGQANREYAA